LEDKMKLMGAEETEMLKASLNNRNAPRQQAQPGPSLPVPGQAEFSRGARNSRHGQQPKPLSARAAQTAAQWGRFVDNIEQHDEQLFQESLAANAEQQVSESVIREVYRPTTLANGQRVGGGAGMVQQVQRTYNHVAAASANGQTAVVSGLQNGIANLGLTNGVNSGLTNGSQAKSADAPGINKSNNRNTPGNQPGNILPNHRGGKAGKKIPTKPSGRGHNLAVQQPTVQQPPFEQAPVQPPSTQHNLLTDGLLIDTSSPMDVSEAHRSPLPGYKVTPHLLAQVGSMTPSPATSVSGSSVFSEAPRSGLAASTLAQARVPAQVQGHAQGQAQAQAQGAEEKNGVEDGEEDWLIEL
jgi:hypothetical protein